jgi:hypothetical protein
VKMIFGDHLFYCHEAKALMEEEITEDIWIHEEYWDDCINQSDFILLESDLVKGMVKIQPRG